jgi:hypothetical protein
MMEMSQELRRLVIICMPGMRTVKLVMLQLVMPLEMLFVLLGIILVILVMLFQLLIEIILFLSMIGRLLVQQLMLWGCSY